MIEQTLSIIKPDAVERNIANKIKAFYEKNNLKILRQEHKLYPQSIISVFK